MLIVKLEGKLIVEEKAVSCIDQLRARISEINDHLLQLDEDFRAR